MSQTKPLSPSEVAKKYTPEQISEMERRVQLEGDSDPDNIYLPNGLTVTQARNAFLGIKAESELAPAGDEKTEEEATTEESENEGEPAGDDKSADEATAKETDAAITSSQSKQTGSNTSPKRR